MIDGPLWLEDYETWWRIIIDHYEINELTIMKLMVKNGGFLGAPWCMLMVNLTG